MGDTFKVTTKALDTFVERLETLGDDIKNDPTMKDVHNWQYASPLLTGNHGKVDAAPDADVQKAVVEFSQRMQSKVEGIKDQADQLGFNVQDVAHEFHSTDENAEWSVQQVQTLFNDIAPADGKGGTGNSGGTGNTGNTGGTGNTGATTT